MSDYNLVILIGSVQDVPHLSYADAVAVCTFTVKVDRPNGSLNAVIEVSRRLAELCSQFLVPGSKVMVVGQGVSSKSGIRVEADRVQFLDQKKAVTP